MGLLENAILEDCGFPCTLKKARVRTKTLPWITRELRVLMRARNYHCNKAKKSGSEEDWKHYKELRNQVTQELRKEKCGTSKLSLSSHLTTPRRPGNK